METTYSSHSTSKKQFSPPSKAENGSQENYEESILSSHSSGGGALGYKPSIAPRSLIIQRSHNNMLSNPVSFKQRSIHYGVHSGAPSANSYALISSTGVNAVRQSSDKEKKDMQDLNERFASYIEKVRFLEAQNRKLADELGSLKAKWGKETTQIKAMYQAELDEARKLLDEATKDKARLEIRIASLEEYNEETTEKLSEANRQLTLSKELIEKQNQQLADVEAELNLLRRRIQGLENDKERDKKTIATLQDNLNRTRQDLDSETLLHIDAENRRQTLEEEIEFLKSVHEQEMKELAALASRDSTAENREYWKAEMGQALREIQNIYDDKLDTMRGELEGFYNLKVQEFKTGATRQNLETNHSKEEAKRLRIQFTDLKDRLNELEAKNSQLERELQYVKSEAENREKELIDENDTLKIELSKLRAEMESILIELQSIVDAKLGLELEIAAYRKLLEGEENRVGLRTTIDNYSSGSGFSSNLDMSMSGGGGGGSGMGMSFGAGGGGGGGAFGAGGGGGGGAFGAGGGGGSGSNFSKSGSSFTMSGNPEFGKPLKGEMSAKTTYQKSAKGPVSVSECSPEGKFVVVDNSSRKSENIGGWKVIRIVDNKRVEFTFKDGYVLEPAGKIKIWARGSKPEVGAEGDLVCHEDSWGIGANVTTKLINANGEEKATHIQKTTYM